MFLMIDNYDSFTYNLVQYFQILGVEMTVVRNDEITADAALKSGAEAIVLSPGPGRPENAGVMIELVRRAGDMPLLGVCLGHQAIAHAFGAKIVPAKRLMHGKISEITHDGRGLFAGVENPFQAVRYHSLAVDRASLPESLIITATSEDGEIMGLRHREKLIEGIQYHPESVLTRSGRRQLRNFIRMVREYRSGGASC
ncbi:MAG: aminodeoxychorismate/anthranilate synthase component II [Lentisphaeria bacterium]|nr:aminodeoxychorismate/anthranilate synthase component II [Lentisphaeria bacterium]